MSLIDLLFGNPSARKKPASTVLRSSTQSSTSPAATRRELVRVVLRDTLRLHGIPAEWVGVETLNTMSREGKPGMHVRLLLRHWEPRLLPLCVALQGSFQSRLMIFDPLAEGWFAGVSWQFALPDNSVCPVMPDAGFWKAAPVVQPPAPVQPPLPAAAAHVPSPLLQHSQAPAQARREALEKLMAEGDRHHGAGAADADPQAFRPTEPAGLV